ncbi:putative succinyl-diaminopimelate desuccinylase [Rubripirellula obstinata]|uniref:Putative succinyl-diaminopimelate desuccinylase n=2 Tax=Rubripirellula obstinata TaxID=406547 RepID=A0A5B1CQ85_9BACT|nr:putative succinyl-diaminopimelate desuccinylase [Rubripirellula obstinata]
MGGVGQEVSQDPQFEIRQAVTDNDENLRSRLTSLTRDLVLIPSTESRPAERKRCFEFLEHHLDATEGVQLDSYYQGGHQSLVVRPYDQPSPEILLCGHIDVIEHSEPDCYHSRVESGRIYGPGSGDMKGQIAIMVELMRTLHKRHPGIGLGLAITSDEEIGGADGVEFLVNEIGLRCGQVIIPDGGSLTDITVAEKGVIHARVTQLGRAAHGARPWLGENAVQKLIHQLSRLNQHFEGYWPDEPIEEQANHWFPTCSITIFETENTTANRIPSQASAMIDVRFPPPHTVASMLAEIIGVLDSGDPVMGSTGVLDPLMTAEPTDLNPDSLFCDITEAITGQTIRKVRASGGSDSRFFCDHAIPVNLSRPWVGNLHAIDEWIDIDSMLTYFKICEQYIERRLGC